MYRKEMRNQMCHNMPLGRRKKTLFFIAFLIEVSVSQILYNENKFFEKWNYCSDSISSSLVWKKQKRSFILC